MEELYKKLKKCYKQKIEEILVDTLTILKLSTSKPSISSTFNSHVEKAVIPFIESSPKTHFLTITSRCLFTKDDPVLRYVPSLRTQTSSDITWFDETSYGSRSFNTSDMTDLIFIRYLQKQKKQEEAKAFIKNCFGRSPTDFFIKYDNTPISMNDLFCSVCLVFSCGFHPKSTPKIIKFDEKSGCLHKGQEISCDFKAAPFKRDYQLHPCIQKIILNLNISCKVFNKLHIKQKKISKPCEKKTKALFYEPCASISSICECRKKSTLCEYFCGCKSCSNTLYCTCKTCDKECICFISSRECTVLCKCNKSKEDQLYCDNVYITKDVQRKVSLCKSKKHGLGLFAEEYIPKNSFVIQYTGELITDKEAERRGNFYEMNKVSYLFNCMFSKDDCLYSIDSFFLGNKSRFINHSSKYNNLQSKSIVAHGETKIVFFSTREIYKGEEFLFDYQWTDEHKLKHGICD